jgi:hypothetical protein
MKEFLTVILDFIMFVAFACSVCMLICLIIVATIEHYKLAIPSIVAFAITSKYKYKSTKGK